MDNSLLAVRDINHKYIVVEKVVYEIRSWQIILRVVRVTRGAWALPCR